VAGFLQTHGFIDSLDDVLTLGVCEEHAVARVRLKNAVPDQLRPILTSGCGTGIAFDLPNRVNPP